MRIKVYSVSKKVLPKKALWLCILLVVLGRCEVFAADSIDSKANDAVSSADTAWKPLKVPKALVVVGVWGDMFRWQDALHTQGITYDDVYRAQNVYHRPFIQINGMPVNFEPYLKYSVVVLANVDAPAIGPERLAALQRFVRAGGGLVVLGGSWAFSRGAYAGTPLEEILPVTFPPQHRIPLNEKGDLLVTGSASKWGSSLSFQQKPRAFYVQKLVPKPNAVVEIQAGDQPAFVSGEYGAGRVVACGLTMHGKSETDDPAFWDWAEWPKLLGYAIDWAAEKRPLLPTVPAESPFKPLREEEIQQVRLEFAPVTEEFIQRFSEHPTEVAATAIFERLKDGKNIKGSLTPAAIEALARFAQSSWREPLQKMSDEVNPDRALRTAAYELLGATRVPATSKQLLNALGDSDVAPAALNGLRRLEDSTHIATIKSLYDKIVEVSDFRNPDGARAQGPVATRNGVLATHAARALYSLGEKDGVQRMATLYREVRFLRRIFANASKRRVADTDATGIAIRKAIYEKHGDLVHLEAYLLNSAGPVPSSQRDAFVRIARDANDESEVRWLAQALMESPSDSFWGTLENAKDGIIRRVAKAQSAK